MFSWGRERVRWGQMACYYILYLHERSHIQLEAIHIFVQYQRGESTNKNNEQKGHKNEIKEKSGHFLAEMGQENINSVGSDQISRFLSNRSVHR